MTTAVAKSMARAIRKNYKHRWLMDTGSYYDLICSKDLPKRASALFNKRLEQPIRLTTASGPVKTETAIPMEVPQL